MYQLRQFWKIHRKVGTLTPTPLRCFHTVPDPETHLHPEQRIGAPRKQAIKRPKRERSPCPPVLDLFDQQYNQELGHLWTSARSVFLDPDCWQYGVMLNRFSSTKDVRQILKSQGFSRFLPQSNGSLIFSDSTAAVRNSGDQTEKDPLLSNCGIFQCPPEESYPHLDSTSHVLSQDLQSEHHPSLQCYIHPYPQRFPSQPHRPGQLKQYYLLNAASLLPVLALQVSDGEKVLDLCSAPGGKAIAIMQCATPGLLCCNEPNDHRRDWLIKTLESFLPCSLKNKVIVSAQDGQSVGQHDAVTYDKVLVDAPCSNDRSWLHCSSSQQGALRLKERARLPALQAQLLRTALSVVRPGGHVVYSTCTLSKSENYDVVEMVLKDCPEAEPESLWEEIAVPFSEQFTFAPAYPSRGHATCNDSLQTVKKPEFSCQHTLGILVVPQPGKAWGPMFLSRIKRKS